MRRVSTPGDLKRFIDLPYRMHARDPNWVPPLRMEVAGLLDRARNPFFEHGTAEYFIAERGGQVVGRIAAIHNRLHNEVHQDKVGFFGFFECAEDQAVADALLAAAERWVRDAGLDVLRGPASFSVNDECGLLVDGFDTPNVVMMPHNPPYYQKLLERANFTGAKDLLVYEGGNATHPIPAPERLVRAVKLMLERHGVVLRPLDMKRFKAEIDIIKRIYNQAWEKNWGFVPMTDAEIDLLAKNFKPVIIPEMVIFAEHAGVPVGFGLAIPDLNEALRTNRGGGTVKGALLILWWMFRKKFTRARIPLLGVIPEFRGKGLDSALYHQVWSKAGDRGIGWGEAGWILEDNPAMKLGLEKMGFVVYKTYRMYDRAISA